MTIYKQYDSRWAKKNYNGSSTIGTAACGPFSVANIVVEHNPVNPLDVVRYMQKNGYAIRHQGTAWAGIPAALKAFGLTDVRKVDVSKSMSKVWEYMNKGYDAVFLFKRGKKGGVCWTTQGHYVGMVDYKVKNGKHYLRSKDSGGRDNDGWYCYETTMRGLIPQVWVGKAVPAEKPTGKYTGAIPKPTLKRGSKGTEVQKIQNFLTWYFPTKPYLIADGVFGTNTEAYLEAFQRMEGILVDGIFGKQSQKKMKGYKA